MNRPKRADEAFRRFVIASSPTLMRAAYLLLRDRDAAEDAVQSTLLRTFRRWDRAQETPEAYSQRVLVNVCRDQWRHRRRHPEATATSLREEVSTPPPTSVSTLPDSERIEQRQALAQALGGLPRQQREVLVLRFFLDFSAAETAQALGIAEGIVKSSTHRGLADLRGLISIPSQEVQHADKR